jgi:hypothetical protein
MNNNHISILRIERIDLEPLEEQKLEFNGSRPCNAQMLFQDACIVDWMKA